MLKDIFKAYDIRGVYPDLVNEDANTWQGKLFTFATALQLCTLHHRAEDGSALLGTCPFLNLCIVALHVELISPSRCL